MAIKTERERERQTDRQTVHFLKPLWVGPCSKENVPGWWEETVYRPDAIPVNQTTVLSTEYKSSINKQLTNVISHDVR